LKERLTDSEYLEHFQLGAGKKIVGEASVWYLFSETAANEIRTFSPGAKILIMLRNPVEVIYSLHSQHLYDGNEDVTVFEAALNLDEERKKGRHLPDSADFFQLPSYIDSVLFSRQVKRYIDIFKKENVHVLLYDDFSVNTEQAVKETLQFLGVSTNISIDYRVVNQRTRIRSFYLHRMIRKPPDKLRRIVRVILPVKKMRHGIMAGILSRNVSYKKQKKENPDLNSRLKNYFKDDIEELGKIIEKDLSGWLK
jgi:hypothetical protein